MEALRSLVKILVDTGYFRGAQCDEYGLPGAPSFELS